MEIDVTIGNDVTMKGGVLAGIGRIDQYELVRELGGGGFGCVFLAKDTVAGIEVAVKGLPPEVKHNKEELENIRANFALVSRLHHPNIAAALVLHPAKEVSYANRDAMEKLRVFERDTMMVMEYAPGVTLSQWRKQFPDKKVPFEKALDITRQVAAALDYAHGEKIVHRDVKPSNVMIETKADGSVVARVLDFGLAAEIRSSMGRVSREIRDTSGTRPYMAPEQWRGAKQGPATDQYALAAMFCELVTGEVPFASVFETGDPVLMKTAVATDAPEFPKELSKAVRLALAKALAKQGEERFATCGAFVAALGGTRSVASAGKTLIAAALLALLSLAAVGGWWWHERVKSEELRVKNEALAAERARQAEESKRKAKEARLAAAKVKVEAEEARRAEEARLAAAKAEAERKAKEEAERQREPKAGDVKTIILPGGVTMEMVWCPPGSFMMGSPLTESERKSDETQRRVVIAKGFWMGKYEVTQRQWTSVMGRNPSEFVGVDRPVECVTWEDCFAFVQRINSRGRVAVALPTETQWEYACRAGTTTPFAFGSALNGDEANCDGNFPYGIGVKGTSCYQTKAVGRYIPNAWGLYDMHGNVWEWCTDKYAKDSAVVVDRISRGGGWNSSAHQCRAAYRQWRNPKARGNNLGFRLVCNEDDLK